MEDESNLSILEGSPVQDTEAMGLIDWECRNASLYRYFTPYRSRRFDIDEDLTSIVVEGFEAGTTL